MVNDMTKGPVLKKKLIERKKGDGGDWVQWLAL